MSEAKKTYRVELAKPLSFPAEQRNRAGIVVLKQGGYEGELDDEQLAEIKADDYLTVKEVKVAAPTPTKKQLIAAAKEEGLDLGEVTEKNTVTEITKAIEDARANAAGGDTEEDDEPEGDVDVTDQPESDSGDEGDEPVTPPEPTTPVEPAPQS